MHNAKEWNASEAEKIAFILACEFLRDGKYSAAHGPIEVPSLAEAVGAQSIAVSETMISTEAFGNIAVQAVGFEEGKLAKDPKVHIYLTRSSAALIKSLPREVGGVQIEAHRMGPITVRPEAAASATNYGHFYQRGERICCGSSCAPTSEICSGTLGALVKTRQSEQIYLLSNNHVLAGCNHVPLHQPILAPSNADARPTMRAPREVGRHASICELRSGDPNFVFPCDADLALAQATNTAIISSWQGADADGYDTPASVSSPQSEMQVKKYGRTTRLTRGIVEARVTSPMPVRYSSKYFNGTVWFTDVWAVRGADGVFALPGDSGSLVVDETNGVSVGLIFAANRNGEYAWIIPMPCVVDAFGGLSLVAGHGI